jgi:hypothetical protein
LSGRRKRQRGKERIKNLGVVCGEKEGKENKRERKIKNLNRKERVEMLVEWWDVWGREERGEKYKKRGKGYCRSACVGEKIKEKREKKWGMGNVCMTITPKKTTYQSLYFDRNLN